LTIVIVTLAAVIGFPVAAFAVVSGSNSFITDPVTGAHAQVTSKGQLQTHQTGAMTVSGTVNLGATDSGNLSAVGAKLGQLNVGADGRLGVDAAPIPAQLFHYSVVAAPGDQCGPLAKPSGFATIITSIHVAYSGPTTHINFYSGALCGDFANPIDRLETTGTANMALDYPTGLGISDGHTLSFYSGATSATVTISVSGYEVPSALCTGDCQ
jgi:hypothetical protein